jgi:cytochrome c-type biogenesis protein
MSARRNSLLGVVNLLCCSAISRRSTSVVAFAPLQAPSKVQRGLSKAASLRRRQHQGPRRIENPLYFSFEDIIFNAESTASSLASSSLQNDPGNLLVSLPIMYGAGLLTSVSPCVWGLLPLTVSYISQAAGERADKRATLPTLVFAAGLAAVFCSLGVAAAQLGGVLGSTGNSSLSSVGAVALPVLSNGVCLIMGLQLLDLVRLPLPTLDFAGRRKPKAVQSTNELILLDGTGQIITKSSKGSANNDEGGSLVRVFLLGGSSALIASPCATPVLTSILAFVATAHNAGLGAVLLLGYTLGYSTPLLWIAGSGGQALAQLREDSRFGSLSQWVTPLTAGVLLWYGTNGMLTTLFGDPSLAGMVIP